MEKHSSLDIGIAQAREKTLPKSKDEQNPKNHTAKSASEDELGKVPLQIDGAAVVAGASVESHRNGLSDALETGQKFDDAQNNGAEKHLASGLKAEDAKPFKRKVRKVKWKAKAKLLEAQQPQGEAAVQLIKTGQVPSTLETSTQSTHRLGNPGVAKDATRAEVKAENRSAAEPALDCTGKPTKRGPRKPHRKDKKIYRAPNGSTEGRGAKAHNQPPGPKQADLGLLANQNKATIVVSTGKEKGKSKRAQKSSRRDLGPEQPVPPELRQHTEEGSESMYQHQGQISPTSASITISNNRSPVDSSNCTPTHTISYHHLTSTCSDITPDNGTVRKRKSNIAATSSVRSGSNQSACTETGKSSLSPGSLNHETCTPRPATTRDHRPLSEPAYSIAHWASTISTKVLSVSGELNYHTLRARKHIRSLSEGSYQISPLSKLLKASDMAAMGTKIEVSYKPMKGDFLASLKSGKYGRSTKVPAPMQVHDNHTPAADGRTPAKESHAQALESHAQVHESHSPAPESSTLAQEIHTTAQEDQKSAEENRALPQEAHGPIETTDTDPTSQKHFSSSATVCSSMHGPDTSNIHVVVPAAASDPPKSTTPLISAEDLNTNTADHIKMNKAAISTSDNIVARPVSVKGTPMPLAENATSRNQSGRAQTRAEKTRYVPYVPPHLRCLQSDYTGVLNEDNPQSSASTTGSKASTRVGKVNGSKQIIESQSPKGKRGKVEPAVTKSNTCKPSEAKLAHKATALSGNNKNPKNKSNLQDHRDKSTKVETCASKLDFAKTTEARAESKAAATDGNIDDSKKDAASMQRTNDPKKAGDSHKIDHPENIDHSKVKDESRKTGESKKTENSKLTRDSKITTYFKKKTDRPTKTTDQIIGNQPAAHDLNDQSTQAAEAKFELETSTTPKGDEASKTKVGLKDQHVSPEKPNDSHALENDSTNGNEVAQPSKPVHPTQKDPEEIFVPLPKSPVTKAPVAKAAVKSWYENLLPPRLQGLSKPVLEGPVVKRNAERAARNPNIDERELMQRVIKRNEAAYKPVLELKPATQLALELASNESTRPAFLAEDRSSLNGLEDIAAATIVSATQKANQEKKWRYFNKLASSHSGQAGNAPKEELIHELVGWDGQWIPAPVEWDVRRQFNCDNKTHVRYLEKWISERVTEALSAPFKVDTTDIDWKSGALPASGTRKQYQVYPPDCIMKRVPLEYGPIDWSLCPTEGPKDGFSNVVERRTQCSRTSARKFHKEYNAKLRERDMQRYQHRLAIQEFNRQNERSQAEMAPKANVYLRPVHLSDVAQITNIYNHYVRNSVQAAELEDTGLSDWRDRVKGATEEKLAFIVAVLKSNKVMGHANKRGRGNQRERGFGRRRPLPTPEAFEETIVGFAYAEDHAGKHTMYEFVAELQLFVDPNHTRQGVGRVLMDRMIASLDHGYHTSSPVEFIKPIGGQVYETGGTRDMHKIMVTVGFHYGQEKEFEWRKNWLQMVWDFDHIATYTCLGNKFGKGVNLAHFVKETNQQHGRSTWYRDQPDRIPHRELAIRAKEKEEAEKAEKELLAREEARAFAAKLRAEEGEEDEYDDDQW